MKLEKVTESPEVPQKSSEKRWPEKRWPEKRWYDDACGTALAMELVGERWSLLIVRELMFGPRRFGELRAGLGGISANVLTQRLEGMEAAGILTREKLPPPASVQVYALTPWGYQSEQAIQELGRWAVRSPRHDPTLPLSAASLMLSFRTMIDRPSAALLDAAIGFRLGNEQFVARVNANGISILREDPADADVVVASDPVTLASIVYGGRAITDAESAGVLALKGDRSLFEHFATLFPLPPKTGSA